MRRITILFAIALVAAVSIDSARAAVIMTSPDGFYDLNLTDPVAVGDGSEGLVAATLQVINLRPSNSAANPSTFNGSIGANGNLHHERPFGAAPAPTNGAWTGFGQTPSPIDSYLNNVGLVIGAPSETGTGTDSAEAPVSAAGNGTQFGYMLQANIGLSQQLVTSDLAHLVWKSGTMVDFNFTVANGIIGATPSAFVGSFTDDVDPPMGGLAVDPADISTALQGAFDNRNGGPIMLVGGMTATNTGGDLGDLGTISALVTFNTDEGDTFATGTATDGDMDGVFDLEISADWASLPKGQVLSGVVDFQSANGSPNMDSVTFSITVPEPSTVALSCLALVGLVGLARRK